MVEPVTTVVEMLTYVIALSLRFEPLLLKNNGDEWQVAIVCQVVYSDS
jgi:hypothetical protein